MAKGQKHGNREIKKPKQVKTAPIVLNEGLLGQAGVGVGTTPNKKRA